MRDPIKKKFLKMDRNQKYRQKKDKKTEIKVKIMIERE